MTSSRVFDVHAHFYHPRWYPAAVNKYLVEDFLRRQKTHQTTRDPQHVAGLVARMLADGTGETTLKIMDKVGIAKRVILIVDWGVELGEPEASIETIHREILSICRSSNGRLIGFAGIDPRRRSAPGLLRWACEELGALGLKLHPTGTWSLEDESTQELVAVAVDRNLPVMVHVGRTMKILSDQHAQPAALLALARRFPRGKFIAGHSGFEQYREFIVQEVPDNVFFDISGWQDWVGADGAMFQQHLNALLRAFPGRVCFGTDSPFFTYNLVSQEHRWTELVSDCTRQAPDDLKFAAAQMMEGPEPLRLAMGGN